MLIKGKKMAFYKITDKALFAKVDAFMQEESAFIKQVKDFVTLVGLEDYSMKRSLYFGASLSFVGVPVSKEAEIDLSKWKKSKLKSKPYLRLLPRKTNKEFYKLWTDNFPSIEFSYKPLLKLIIQEEYCPFTKGSLGISWKKGTYFCFDTDKYTPAMGAVEILTSEYNELTKSAKGE